MNQLSKKKQLLSKKSYEILIKWITKKDMKPLD